MHSLVDGPKWRPAAVILFQGLVGKRSNTHLANGCGPTVSGRQENPKMAKKAKMTASDAARIQSHADKTGTAQDFKSRAQRSAARNK